MATRKKHPALRLIEEMGIARPRELQAYGVSRAQISRLVKAGLVLRQARGIYVAARHSPSEKHSLAQVAKRVP